MELTRKKLIDSSLNKSAIWTATVLTCICIYFGFNFENILISILGWTFATIFFEVLIKLTFFSSNIEKGNFQIINSRISDKEEPFLLKIGNYNMNVSPNVFQLFDINDSIFLVVVNDIPFSIYSTKEFKLDDDLKKFVI